MSRTLFETWLELDRFLFLSINQGTRNPIFDWLMPLISEWRYYWIPVSLSLAAALWKGTARTRWMVLGLAVVIAFGDSITTIILKPFFDRPRPFSTMDNIFVYKAGQWAMSNLVEAHETISFPSNHAVNSAAAAAVLIYFFPRWWLAPTFLTVLICYSRVYLGVHYPADVLAGVMVGLACAGLFLAIQTGLVRLFPDRFSWLVKEAPK